MDRVVSLDLNNADGHRPKQIRTIVGLPFPPYLPASKDASTALRNVPRVQRVRNGPLQELSVLRLRDHSTFGQTVCRCEHTCFGLNRRQSCTTHPSSPIQSLDTISQGSTALAPAPFFLSKPQHLELVSGMPCLVAPATSI